MRIVHLVCGVLLCAACGDDSGETPIDARPPTPDAEPEPDAEPPPTASVERGAYLVDHVLDCSGCHTPFGPNGPDLDNYLAGVECFIDANGDTVGGCLNTRNLTNHATGLMTRSDAEIKAMFLNGTRPDGSFLRPEMPYWIFHNMNAIDADSIVMYLRTVTGVDHTVPANDIVYFPPPLAAAAFFDVSHMPMETTQSEQITRGKYLVRMACIDCHTQLTDPNDWRSIDETKLLAGARDFPRAFLGLPDTFPEHIYSMNLTPHDPTGIYLYDAADIIKVLKMGIDGEGNGVCPPMPGGPMAAFGGLTDADAADIAAYIDALPANEQARPNECSVPLGP